jgi:hypothetical protein
MLGAAALRSGFGWIANEHRKGGRNDAVELVRVEISDGLRIIWD